MDVDFEMLGTEKVVINLKDFQDMMDIIAYDRAKAADATLFSIQTSLEIVQGQNALKMIRKHQRISQAALSERSGVPQGLISEIETGKKTGSITSLRALAKALDVFVDDLI